MDPKKAANYVKTRNKTLPEYQFGNFHVLVQDPLSEDINISKVFKDVNGLLPEHFLNLVDIVYIGEFDFLKEREINAMYSDGALYISNVQDDNSDLKDDIVHEIAHAVEEKYGQFLYSDEDITNEFLLKRKKLKEILSFQDYDMSGLNFFETEYDEEFDNFLYNDIGYDALQMLAVELFINPYAITSLREYFSTGFEEYYLENRLYLREISPYIYRKLSLLEEKDVEELQFYDNDNM
jgi:hypothetical protein